MIKPFKAPANFFKTLAHPARLAILSVLREGEQCVCHIEAMLKLRQAYISQHLKVLKDAEIVTDRRDGWNMYYRVSRPEVFEIMEAMFGLTGQPDAIPHAHSEDECPCPKCHSTDDLIVPDQITLQSAE
ncbi:MAG: metalloregulator ArsR/SmtB family transcription factor [Anaerolineales bacterium]|jgi:ArsR family transcriptional regulator